MIIEKELLGIAKENGLLSFSVDVNTVPDDLILLSSNSVNDLVEFAKTNDISTIFYSYDYYTSDDYLLSDEDVVKMIDSFYRIYSLNDLRSIIGDDDILNYVGKVTDDVYCSLYISLDDTYDNIDNDIDADDRSLIHYIISNLGVRGVENKIKDIVTSYFYTSIEQYLLDYNSKIEGLDYNRPKTLYLFTVYKGKTIGIVVCDDWLDYYIDEVGIELQLYTLFLDNTDTIATKIQNIVNNVKKEIDKRESIEEEKRKELDSLRDEFKNFLLSDSEFLSCTNEKLRRHYARNLFNRDDVQKYKLLFTSRYEVSGEEYLNMGELNLLIDKIWKEYKNKK